MPYGVFQKKNESLFMVVPKRCSKKQIDDISKIHRLRGKGIIRLSTPGNMPYTMTARCLNENIVTIDDEGYIHPISTGKADIIIDFPLVI